MRETAVVLHSTRTHTMVLCVILCAILPSLAMAALTPPTHPLFDGDAVHEIHLTFHQTSWYDSLVSNFEGLEEPLYLAAEFEWETIHFDSIGVRFKGNSSYYSYPSDKKSFKLDINAFVDGQEIYGLDKLNLNNGFLDPSFVREKCCYELCKAAGLPTERTNFAALYINEIYWGLYTIVEQYDQEFIESRFGNSEEGNLWKGDEHGTLEYLGPNQELYYSEYELKTNEEENDWSALIELVDKLNNTPLVDLSDTLHNLMDVNSALALLAVDNLTVNLDSYTGRCCNYYCYHRNLDSRFVFANWDVNESWGIFSMGMSVAQLKQLSPFWTINRPGENRPLAERLWQVDAYEAIYLGHMKKLMAIAAQPDWLLTRMEDLRDIIRPYVLADTKKMFSNAQFEAAMTSDINAGGPPPGRIIPGLESFMRERDTYLRNLIGTWTPIEGLVLNEVMARNNATLADEYGDYDDWIEITNVSTFSINLNGLGLNDHMDGTQSYIFPDTTLAPGAYLLVWADEEPEQGAFHAPFKLDGDGEDVYLIDGAVVIEQMTFPALDTDVSWGRWPDGTGEWQLLSEATPGVENRNPVEPEEIVLFINEFLALNEGVNTDETGAYEDWVEIYNPGPEPIEMGGLFLTDDLTNTTQWTFPDTTLQAGSFLLVWCDNDPEDGAFHATFKLSGDGEAIGLFGRLAAGNELIDSYIFGAQTTDISEGRETDGGDSWVFFDNPTPGASNSQTAVENPLSEIPDKFALFQNYPNPFNPSTTIQYTLPEISDVTINIYDILGRIAETLVHEKQPAGQYQIVWNAGDRPSGLYFIQMKAGDFIATKKMVLLK